MPDNHARRESDDTVATSVEAADGGETKVVERRVSHADEDSATEYATVETRNTPRSNRNLIIVAAVAALALVVLVLLFWSRGKSAGQEQAAAEAAPSAEQASATNEVTLSGESLQTAGIEVEGVTQRPAVALMRVTGTVESNQQQTQEVTPLVSGRVERVYAALGDRVRAGTPLAVISSPQIAQLHAKLHDAETHLSLAERNLQRVQRSENRVAVLQAKAKLDEAEATLNRTRRLIDLGAGAGKDLVSAETAYKTAKAEYEFQSNITLNKEVQEARVEVETTRVEISHIKDEMRALGAAGFEGGREDRDTSLITLRAPASGAISERLVNPGAGIEPGKPLFKISNLSTVWVVASVPEAQVGLLNTGTAAEVRSAALGSGAIAGRVAYIDPQLNEGTRTARVRVDVANPGERLKVGMFADVGFQTSTGAATGQELVVSSSAIQRLGTKTIVFMPKQGETGVYEVREVEVGGDSDGYTRIISGLKLGDAVVTKGSFTLKTQLEKGSLE